MMRGSAPLTIFLCQSCKIFVPKALSAQKIFVLLNVEKGTKCVRTHENALKSNFI